MEETDLYGEAYSYMSGKELKYFNAGFFLERIETDELFYSIGITFQEFNHLFKYYKLTPYIIGDDTEELYATRRKWNDPDLQDIVKLLNMKPVKIVKTKHDKDVARFTIEPYQKESDINYEEGSYIFTQSELLQHSSNKSTTLSSVKLTPRTRIKGGSIYKTNKKTDKKTNKRTQKHIN